MNKVKLKDVPAEVLEAIAIMQNDMVGEFLYNKVQDTIKKYPGYFKTTINKLKNNE